MFRDRREAGRLLAEELDEWRDRPDVLVLALPRGGVVIGYEIARRLHAPLDVFIVRKIGFPGQLELALGAVAETGAVVLNPELMHEAANEYVDRVVRTEKGEIARRVTVYRGGRKMQDPTDKTVILVDDGLATGATAKAAVQALKQEEPKELVVAVPVAPADTAAEFERLVDRFVCLQRDPLFFALGAYYRDFSPVSDEEVVELLRRASPERERKAV